MEKVRIAEFDDRKAYYDLWKICFGDSDAFCQWFFHHRFYPSLSVCLEKDGVIPSAMQAFPYSIWIRGKEVDGAMLCGVSTHPQYRKRGYMGKIFSYNMEVLRENGKAVAVHTPAVLESYFSFGHEPVADACYLTAAEIPYFEKKKDVYFLEGDERKKAFACYQEFAKKYSGMVLRNETDFLRKLDDYAADGGVCLADHNENLRAYVCYYLTETELICVEAVGEDQALQSVLEGMFAYGTGRKLSVKLAPDTKISFSFTRKEVKQKGVMGLVSIEKLLKSLDLQSKAVFAVEDSVVAENNGCFDLSGKRRKEKPAFVVKAGKLLPVIVGYASLEEQRAEIEIYDEKGFLEIAEALPKIPCYIIDEY